MSPELGTEVREGADNVELNTPYEIVNIDAGVVTDVSFYAGVRVEMLTQKAKEGTIMLWKRPVTSPGSKLGSFITLLGSNTDKWLHKWIKFTAWEKNKRVIELLPVPVEKATKAKSATGIIKVIKKG